MRIFNASDFDEFEEYDVIAQNSKRANRHQKNKTAPTGGTMSAQYKRMEENNFYAGENKKIRKRARIRESESN